VSETDVKGNITYVNDMFCKISGYSREELMGNNHRIVKSEVQDDQFWKDFWKTIASGQVWQGVICNKAKDGSHYWVGTTVTPVLNNEGKPIRYIGVRFDITQQKEQEIALDRMRIELAQAKTLVEEELSRANDQLRDSVIYAQRMLRAILPSESDINEALPSGWEAGVFFQPRDVVGGDFYWIGKYKNRLVLATGDGTGHGVPGSFLSIIGITSLRKLVEERGLTTPAEVLEELDSDYIAY
jgi:PAS domain S-box-containing protein